MTRSRRFFGLFCFGIVALAGISSTPVWAQQTRDFSILPYRTEISPGSPEQDALFVASLVPDLSKLMFGEMTGEGMTYESIDVYVNRRFARERDGTPIRDEAGRVGIEAEVHLTIKGERFYAAALSFLNWRQSFEQKWIHDASPENIELEPTPLQLIQRERSLSLKEKVMQVLIFYQLSTRKEAAAQEAIPDPEYWPISPIFDIDSLGVQVQFSIRGGVATVLHASSSRVWRLPFPATGSCDRWIGIYEREAKKSGLEQAADKMREVVKDW